MENSTFELKDSDRTLHTVDSEPTGEATPPQQRQLPAVTDPLVAEQQQQTSASSSPPPVSVIKCRNALSPPAAVATTLHYKDSCQTVVAAPRRPHPKEGQDFVSALTEGSETAQVLEQHQQQAGLLPVQSPPIQPNNLVQVLENNGSNHAPGGIPFVMASPVFLPEEEQMRNRIAQLEARESQQQQQSATGSHDVEAAANEKLAKAKASKRKCWIIGGILSAGLVVIIVALAIVLATTLGGEDDSMVVVGTSKDGSTLQDRIVWIQDAMVVPFNYTPLSNMTNTIDEYAVEELAMALVVESDEDGSLSRERVIQRYALATVFLAEQRDAMHARIANSNEEESNVSWNTTEASMLNAAISAEDFTWWNFTNDECSWPGITCGTDNLATTLILSYGEMQGTLPADVGLLTTLMSLQVENNTLTGTIPASLGRLTGLRQVHLFDNAFTGTFPDEAFGARMTDLQVLRVGNNQLTGTFPTILAPAVEWISFYRNNLSGTLPDDIFANGGPRSTIQALVVSHNQLTGTIPDVFWSGELQVLGHLVLNDNQLTGTLPAESVLFDRLELRQNQLTGTIPLWTRAVPDLDLGGNNFTTTTRR